MVGPESEQGLGQNPEKPVVNNLLPEILLTPEQLARLSPVLIVDLGLLRRTHHALTGREAIDTVGDLLSWEREKIIALRGFGTHSAIDLGEKLQQLLELPEGKYSPDFIQKLFLSAYPPHQVKKIEERGTTRSREQYWEDRRKALMAKQINEIRQLVRSIQDKGFASPEEIHSWFIERDGRVLGQHPRSWLVRAMIEYVVNHPED